MKIWVLGESAQAEELRRLFEEQGMETAREAANGIRALTQEEICCAVDAGEPINEDVKQACRQAGVPYIRLKNRAAGLANAIELETAAEAVKFLNENPGNVLLLAGAQEMEDFAPLKERVHLCLPLEAALLERAGQLGYFSENITALGRPLTMELGLALLGMSRAEYLVTESGCSPEAAAAVRAAGARLIVVGKSFSEELDFTEAARKAAELYDGRVLKLSEKKASATSNGFPMFMDISGQNAVVIGAGKEGCSRANMLQSFGAKVTVIAPELRGQLDEGIEYIQQEFDRMFDLEYADIAIAATDDKDVNRSVAFTAKSHGSLLNCVDDPALSTFRFPEIVRGAEVTLGMISGNPQLSGELAGKLRGLLPLLEKGN